MTQIQLKRVYEAEDKSDGFRVLVDRLWPRGIKKENLHYDLWAKEITPSPALRQWFHQDQGEHWELFRHKYLEELQESPDTEPFLKQIKEKKMVTLLYASKSVKQNHAQVLKEYLESHLK